jgi:chromatin remodeling complex protein RSC6
VTDESKPNRKRQPNANNMPPLQLSAALAAVIGPGPKRRTEITADLWTYIRAHGLQDPKNKRMIRPDALLGRVLGPPPISMFHMQRAISAHVSPAPAADA